MNDSSFVIITFYTTADAMATEKICKSENIEGKLISAPREYSADCGIAWRSGIEYKDILIDALKTNKIEYEGVHVK